MKGKIAYRFETPVYPGDIVYVNLIARYSCTNNCLFCERPRKEEDFGKANIYKKKVNSSLFLPNSPELEEIMWSIKSEIKEKDRELAIIGLGEPLIYLPKVVEVIKRMKEDYRIKTRVDTNGLVKYRYSNPVNQLRGAGLDEIRISLNAINEEEYQQLCRPRFKNAFPKLICFIKECLTSGIDTYTSFVVDFEHPRIKTRTKEEYLAFAKSLGIGKEKVILREYVNINQV